MPTYQYACTDCDHAFDRVQPFSEDSLTVCPACEGRLRKIFNAVGVVFKGSGFYRNDSRADAKSASASSSAKNKSSNDSGSKSTPSDGSGSDGSASDKSSTSSSSSESSTSDNSSTKSTAKSPAKSTADAGAA